MSASATAPGDDADPAETREWLDALAATFRSHGASRVRQLLTRLASEAARLGVAGAETLNTPYLNTLSPDEEAAFPGGDAAVAIEERLTALVRWNALAMVVRANRVSSELGGHLASYASGADLFEVGFNHFFKARNAEQLGDLVLLQPHSAPGVYARAFLEGRLSEDDLAHYRQELEAKAQGLASLSSYPHPWLAPRFWEFPTGSMGLGPLASIHAARFLRYLDHRRLLPDSGRRVWGFFGDGEMDEPESLAGLSLAGREHLGNLKWVINCNLQRLDGPVRGNARIVDELERQFVANGWRVIKVLWGTRWDPLFAGDDTGSIAEALGQLVDGELQALGAHDARFNRERFFARSPALARLAARMTDRELDGLRRGGNDIRRIHAGLKAAEDETRRPCVVLALTKKGFGMGPVAEGRMTSHQHKKLDRDALLAFRDRFGLPLDDAQCEAVAFHRPAAGSVELAYLMDRRAALGGFTPARTDACATVPVPSIHAVGRFAFEAGERPTSTTNTLVRLLGLLMKAPGIGERIVPIVADEARTFGMQSLFRRFGIYSPCGQAYEPEDVDSMLQYREAKDGQILEEGINEAGALASWTAAATSYAVNGFAMLPVYVFYSIFGFQRVGDQIWAAADQRARGILVGATSGRTTLAGEGLQHQDGSSHAMAADVPNCVAYDPCFAGELAVILDHAARSILERQEDRFFYLTVSNQNVVQRALDPSDEAGVVRGMYRLSGDDGARVRLLGAGALLPEAIEAAALLQSMFAIPASVYSVTSFSELARDGRAVERERRLFGSSSQAWITRLLEGDAPVIAVSDYVRQVPDSVRAYVRAPYHTLGCDGFGRSDTRARLREFFEVDARWMVHVSLAALGWSGERLAAATRTLGLQPAPEHPWRS